MDVGEEAGRVGAHRGREGFGAAAARGVDRHLRGRHLREGPVHRVHAVVGERGRAVDRDDLRRALVHHDDFPVVGRPQRKALVAAAAGVVVQAQIELEGVARGQRRRKRPVHRDGGPRALGHEAERIAEIERGGGAVPDAAARPARAGIRREAPRAEAAAAVRAVRPAAGIIRGRVHVHRSQRRPRQRQHPENARPDFDAVHGVLLTGPW